MYWFSIFSHIWHIFMGRFYKNIVKWSENIQYTFQLNFQFFSVCNFIQTEMVYLSAYNKHWKRLKDSENYFPLWFTSWLCLYTYHTRLYATSKKNCSVVICIYNSYGQLNIITLLIQEKKKAMLTDNYCNTITKMAAPHKQQPFVWKKSTIVVWKYHFYVILILDSVEWKKLTEFDVLLR